MGRPARISRAAVVDTVLELGLDKATIAEVAARLGVDPSTLYGHVRGRDDMLDAAADTALARAPWPPADDGDWRTYLTALAEALWELYSSTPGLALHLRTTAGVSPTLVARSTEVVTTLCERFGFGLFDAALVTDAVGDTVIDSYLTIAAFDRAAGSGTGQLRRDATAGALGGEKNDDDTAGAYHRLLANTIGDPDASDRWWRQKVQLVLDGEAYRLLRGGTGDWPTAFTVACD